MSNQNERDFRCHSAYNFGFLHLGDADRNQSTKLDMCSFRSDLASDVCHKLRASFQMLQKAEGLEMTRR